ncbi:MAG: DUF1272 domain-containing protein [Planctomycetota bacterium]|nr:DUF1272 domain-containing protein [Planctomycetota bacterium]
MSLEMRANCERCGAATPADGEAWICSYECTWCRGCRDSCAGICPNCGGDLTRRPTRIEEAQGDA